MFGPIRTKIVKVINEMAESPIKEVCRTERSSFAGYPAVTVSPSESLADYHETKADSQKRTYNFTIRAYYPFVDGEDAADLRLEKVVDALLDLFQDKTILGTAADWIAPAPSIWGYQKKQDGQFRIAEIKIMAIKYFS